MSSEIKSHQRPELEVSRVPATGDAAEQESLETQGKAPPAKPKADSRGPARRVALGILLLFGGIITVNVLSDLYAPTSSTGSVSAFTTQMAPRVSGQVAHVYVNDNQAVEAGDPLFSLDARPFDLATRQAEANLATALQAVESSAASLDALRAQVQQAESSVESLQAGADREQMLFDRGVSSQVKLDAALSQLASAQSSLEAARANLLSSQMKIGTTDQSNPQIAVAQVQLEQAQLNQQFATIVAPADGVITNLKLAVGQFVNAGSASLTFIESKEPWITVDLRENQLANIDVGDAASIMFDAVPGRRFQGVVKGIAWGIDPGRTAANGLPQNLSTTRWFEPSRSIPVQIELVDSVDWPQNVRVGSKANALVFAGGESTPIAWLANGIQAIQSMLAILF